tara:strand:- start:530 stop:766 length:237 start_codon:yes stop_codon:yes gene_type:complete
MGNPTYDRAVKQLHQDFSKIAGIVDEMKTINSDWAGLDNNEYYEKLEELARVTEKAFNYFDLKVIQEILGPLKEDDED